MGRPPIHISGYATETMAALASVTIGRYLLLAPKPLQEAYMYIDRYPVNSKAAACCCYRRPTAGIDGRTPDRYIDAYRILCGQSQ